MQWIDALLQGLMLGGLYALFAAGLSLMFGVMRLVNVAHGDFIVLSAFVVVGLLQALHIESLLLASLLVVPLMAAFGYVLQRVVLNPTLGGDMLRPVLVTFGLSVIVQNALLQAASADARRLQAGGLEHVSLPLFGPLALGAFPLLTFGLAVLTIVLLQALLYRTALGRSLRAVADDGEHGRPPASRPLARSDDQAVLLNGLGDGLRHARDSRLCGSRIERLAHARPDQLVVLE